MGPGGDLGESWRGEMSLNTQVKTTVCFGEIFKSKMTSGCTRRDNVSFLNLFYVPIFGPTISEGHRRGDRLQPSWILGCKGEGHHLLPAFLMVQEVETAPWELVALQVYTPKSATVADNTVKSWNRFRVEEIRIRSVLQIAAPSGRR